MVTRVVLASLLALVPVIALAQAPIDSGVDSKLIGDNQIEAVLDVLKRRNTEVQFRDEFKRIVEYRKQYYRSGIFGRRVCVRIVPVQRTVLQRVAVTVERIEKGIGWDDPSDSRLGFTEKTFAVAITPVVAGGRGSRANSFTIKFLPAEVDLDVTNLDRAAVVTSTAFSRDPKFVPPGKERIYRVLALIGGGKDDSVTLTVMVQERDIATGVFENNKAALKIVADGIWNSIHGELTK